MQKKETWTIKSCLNWTTEFFSRKKLNNPRLEAELLLGKALGKDRVQLYMHLDQPLHPAELVRYRVLIKQRLEGVPAAYLLGEKEFMSLPFEVNRDVLIPRPDTEVLVEAAIELLGKQKFETEIDSLEEINKHEDPLIVDVGTGCGNIAVVLAHSLPQARVIAIDISARALEVAKRNATRHGVLERISFYEGDLLSPLENLQLKEKVDLITANLPYIPSNELPHLMTEVLQEPIEALDGGKDGLVYYRRLIPQALEYLKPGGFIIMEIGMEQGKQMQKLMEEDWEKIQLKRDYGGRDRIVLAQKSR